MNHERTLAESAFPDDDGTASPELREVLAAVQGANQPTPYLRAVAALCAERILVPVIASATSVGTGARGLASDKEADMAVVLLQTADGSRALLGFTGLDSLQAWNPQARPVPVTLDLAAQSAVSDGAVALLIDFAGPAPLVIDGEVLSALASGHRLIELPGAEFGWMIPEHDVSPTQD